MKNKLFISLFLILGTFNSQYLAQIRKLNDPSIVAQHKRMVFESWGNWLPAPKYVFGVQTNWAHGRIWGNNTFLEAETKRRNLAYKNGRDRRPLKPDGYENLRNGSLFLQQKEAEKIKISIDSVYSRNLEDFAQWTSLTVDADPFWILYFRKKLKALRDFPAEPQNYKDWGMKDEQTYETLKKYGGLENLQEKLDLLKDKYYQVRNTDMPRGKRIIMYHNILYDWRDFEEILRGHKQKSTFIIRMANTFDKVKGKKNITQSSKTDREIVQSVMQTYKNQF